jgi:DNA-binding MarR family transcriptional regulator
LRAKHQISSTFSIKDEQLALRKSLLFVEAFRAIRRLMPLQHAYAFLLVALEEGHSVSEYAKRVGVTQAVMTRILFSLGSTSRARVPSYGLVHQAGDPKDSRKTQTFLSAKGKVLVHEIRRLMLSDSRAAMKLLTAETHDLARDQGLSQLIAVGRKLDADDIQLAVRQLEALIGHRESTKVTLRRKHRIRSLP